MPHPPLPFGLRYLVSPLSSPLFQDSTRNADLPYDFFMSRYKDAYLQETKVGGGGEAGMGEWRVG